MFWNKICGLIGIFFLTMLFSSAQTISYVKFWEKGIPKSGFKLNYQYFIKEEIKSSLPYAAIPQNYYTQHFGIMCKKELAIEKITKVPLRFRLGSISQCNYLEGKK